MPRTALSSRLAVTAMERIDGTRAVESVHVRRTGSAEPLPFNVKDGISQPWMLGVPAPSRKVHPRGDKFDPRGGGKLGMWGRWQPLALGEFVLGQVDEANDMIPVPEPAPLFIGGTFAAVRKLEIDRARLDGLLDDLTPGGCRQATLDRLVGRRAEGAPLAVGTPATSERPTPPSRRPTGSGTARTPRGWPARSRHTSAAPTHATRSASTEPWPTDDG